jgi:hypothetical protein
MISYGIRYIKKEGWTNCLINNPAFATKNKPINQKTMFNDPKGPIEHFSWGKFIINGETHGKTASGKEGKGKDIRLIGNKVKKWKSRDGHKLKPEMVEKMLDKGLDTLIIGIGVNGLIECPDKVKQTVKKNGIKDLILLKTPEACQKYNELYNKGHKVGLLAHGTC